MNDERGNTAPGPRSSRRQFAKRAAAALAAAPLAAASLAAQTDPPKEPKAPPNPQPTPTPPTPTPGAQKPPPISPAAEAYAAVARARFGQFMNDEEAERVKRDLEGNVRAADRLRASKLRNADEPDFVFEA